MEQKCQVREFSRKLQFHTSATTTAPLDLPESENFSENRVESQIPGRRTLESQPTSIVTFTCKDTMSTWISGLPVENVELLTLQLIISDRN